MQIYADPDPQHWKLQKIACHSMPSVSLGSYPIGLDTKKKRSVDPDPDNMKPERGRPTMVVSDGPVLVQEWHEEQSQLLGHVTVVHSKVVLKTVTLLYDGLC
jgi:hypothetical protein